MTRRLALPFLTDGPTPEQDLAPTTVDRRRLLWLRFLFVMAWIALGVALAAAALASR